MIRRHLQSLFVCFLGATASFDPKYTLSNSSSYAVPIDISYSYNNRAFAASPNDADFDGSTNSYPASYMPPSSFVYSGINFTFPTYAPTGNDNVLASGQAISVPNGRYFSVYILASAQSGSLTEASMTFTYSDNTNDVLNTIVPVWWYDYLFGGDIVFPYFYTKDDVDWNKSMIYLISSSLDSQKELNAIHLPGNETGVHVFALSLLPADGETGGVELEVQYARSTQKRMEGMDDVQVVEVVVNNVGDEWVAGNGSVSVSVESPKLETVVPGKIKRLRPGDQAKVVVGVRNTVLATAGSKDVAKVVLTGAGIHVEHEFDTICGIVPYTPTFESIYTHESPEWFDGAKYGIFIHWGLYSIPGWGNSGSNETYAEWYWWNMNAGPDTPDRTYQYDLETYGPSHVYDDFIADFNASAWNPEEWIDLFADSGAQYFVQVTKHHDGFALFESPENSTMRNSVAQNPHRNFVKELFDAAEEYQPHLRRGTYFSLPEWFNPAYAVYGMGRWPGHNATNPYTNQTLPYTGYVPVSDYLQDLMLPQMNALADLGTDIVWCDAGGANVSIDFASSWFNTAASQNREVVMNNRCGIPGDFDTPEYSTLNVVPSRKWESNLGMDPFSYGYNRATPASAYMNASTIVRSLIDIVSKNGNLLLDIGPTGNGSILEVEADILREAGSWINGHAEAIFNTTYWFTTPGEGETLRFMQTLDAFYIHSLSMPSNSVIIDSPVPYIDGDDITVVGGNCSGSLVDAHLLDNGSLELIIPTEVVDCDRFAWVFKIQY